MKDYAAPAKYVELVMSIEVKFIILFKIYSQLTDLVVFAISDAVFLYVFVR